MANRMTLLRLTGQEIKNFKSGNTIIDRFGYRFNIKDLLPEVVIEATLKRFNDQDDRFWCTPRLFYHQPEHVLVGSGFLMKAFDEPKVEIGYGIVQPYEGKGYATFGVACLIREILTRQEIEVIVAQTSVDNIASERVLEKNGFLRNGQFEDEEDGRINLWKYEIKKSNNIAKDIHAGP